MFVIGSVCASIRCRVHLVFVIGSVCASSRVPAFAVATLRAFSDRLLAMEFFLCIYGIGCVGVGVWVAVAFIVGYKLGYKCGKEAGRSKTASQTGPASTAASSGGSVPVRAAPDSAPTRSTTVFRAIKQNTIHLTEGCGHLRHSTVVVMPVCRDCIRDAK